MAFIALSCPSSELPRHRSFFTNTGVFGKNALISRALEITQISVHKPTSVTLYISSNDFKYSPNSTLPKVGLSIILQFRDNALRGSTIS